MGVGVGVKKVAARVAVDARTVHFSTSKMSHPSLMDGGAAKWVGPAPAWAGPPLMWQSDAFPLNATLSIPTRHSSEYADYCRCVSLFWCTPLDAPTLLTTIAALVISVPGGCLTRSPARVVDGLAPYMMAAAGLP